MGAKPSKATPADRRLKENQGSQGMKQGYQSSKTKKK